MARPRSLPPEVRRTKILDAARAVMIKKGYQDFRVADVAKEAGIASGTVYLYFKDKDEVFAEVFTDLLGRLDQRIQEETEELKGLEALRKTAYAILTFVDEYQDFLFQFTGEHPALMTSEAGQRLRERYAAHLQGLAARVKECVKRGELRNFNISIGSIYLSFLARMFMINKILTQTKQPLNARTPELMDLFLNGLGKKGRRHA